MQFTIWYHKTSLYNISYIKKISYLLIHIFKYIISHMLSFISGTKSKISDFTAFLLIILLKCYHKLTNLYRLF